MSGQDKGFLLHGKLNLPNKFDRYFGNYQRISYFCVIIKK